MGRVPGGRAKADAAFATLMAWYGGPIYRRIWGFVRSDAAEDVFQDVLVRLHRRRHRFADFEHALRWLRGVAVTQSLNARRGDVRRTIRERTRPVASGNGGGTGTAELVDALRVALAKLPDREREAVALVYFEGMTRQDGAAALGVHRDTIAKLLDAALGRLKSALAATAVGAAVTTAGVETALAANPGLPVARLSVLAEAACVNARGPAVAWLPARKLVPLILAGALVAVAAAATFSWSGFMARTRTNVRLQVDRLEPREVPTVGLESAIGVGSDTGSTLANAVAVDGVGNRYVTGCFGSTVDFDPNRVHPGDADRLTARGGRDVFVAKYGPDDRLLWAVRMGGDNPKSVSSDIGRKITVDRNGNVVVVGDFEGVGDFGSAAAGPVVLTSSGGSVDGFVAVLDPAGRTLWAKAVGGTGSDYGKGVGVDAAGSVYALTFKFGVGYGIHKFRAVDGRAEWEKRVDTLTGVVAGDMAVDGDGNVYAVGVFANSVDLDPSPTRIRSVSAGASLSGFTLKLDARGNYVWGNAFNTNWSADRTRYGFAFPTVVAVDGGQNVFVGGHYNGDLVDFDPSASGSKTLPANGGGFVVKLNRTGGLDWAAALEDDASTANIDVTVDALTVDATGGVYVGGGFTHGIDLDPGAVQLLKHATPSGEFSTVGTQAGQEIHKSDGYVVKLTASGSLAWAETLGGPGSDKVTGVAIDPSGFVHLTGTFQQTVDFDPDTNVAFDLATPDGRTGLFLVKLRQN